MVDVSKKKLRDLFEKSYKDFSDAIFRYCYFHTSNREKALDLSHDTFVKTWEYLSSEKGKEIDNIRAFLYRVARNLIIDDRRKKKSSSLDNLLENGFEITGEESEFIIKENEFEAKKALKAVEGLEEKYKDVILMRYVEDMSVKDIAKILDDNENTVSVRIHRGIEKLKNILSENEEK